MPCVTDKEYRRHCIPTYQNSNNNCENGVKSIGPIVKIEEKSEDGNKRVRDQTQRPEEPTASPDPDENPEICSRFAATEMAADGQVEAGCPTPIKMESINFRKDASLMSDNHGGVRLRHSSSYYEH